MNDHKKLLQDTVAKQSNAGYVCIQQNEQKQKKKIDAKLNMNMFNVTIHVKNKH